MKYTRYDLKKKRKNKILIAVILISMIVVIFFIGTILSNTFFKALNEKNEKLKPVNSTPVKKSVKFAAVQGGMFQNKEYEDEAVKLLISYGIPFTIKEQKGTRVFLGIYTESEVEKYMKLLTDNGIENSKMAFSIDSSDNCDAEIVEIINANIQILTKLSEQNVKSIQTDSLKSWCSSLREVDKGSSNISVLGDFKTYINSLPKELTKEKAVENYVFIYNTLKKMV